MLELKEFSGSLTKLEKYLNKKLSDDQLDIFWEKLKHIPGKVFYQIIDKMIDDLSVGSKFPVPSQFLQAWQDWQKENPGKILKRKIVCQFCDNRGYLNCLEVPLKWREDFPGETDEFYWKHHCFVYDIVVNCGHCHSKVFSSRVVPEYTIEQIQEMRWLKYGFTKQEFLKEVN